VATLRIGIAQLVLAPLEVEANVARTVDAVEKAAAEGARVVVLPELASSGYVLHEPLVRPCAEDVAAPGPALTAWSEAAARTGATVVAGFPEVEDGRLYNSAAVFGPDGQLLAVYRKLHLFAGEQDVFTPGDRGLPIVEVDGIRLGVLVCYDLRFPEAVRIHALRDVDLVAVPTAWVGGFDAPDTRAAEIGQVRTARVMANVNAIPLACASQVGQAGPFAFLGSSVLIDPFGTDVAPPASRTKESVAVLDLDLGRLRLARHRGEGMSPLDQRRTDVYAELLGYTDPLAPAEER
jgi:N-carbamoylputrescine amidase